MIRNRLITASALFLTLITVHTSVAASIDVIGNLSREFTMQLGDKAEGTVLVRNNSSTAQLVNVSQVDYSFQADGNTNYGGAGSVPRSNSAWMTVSPKLLTIPANSSAPVYFTISAPSDKTLSGSYWSVLMVEPIAEGSLEQPKTEKDKISVGIRTIMRYAIQVVTNIGTTGKRSIKILQKQLLANATGNIIQLDIENTGERWLRPNIRVELYDEKGVLAGRFDGQRVRIYPTCSVRSQIKLGKVAPGKYTALTIIDNGDQSIWGVKYALDIK